MIELPPCDVINKTVITQDGQVFDQIKNNQNVNVNVNVRMKIKFIVHLTNKFFATCDAQLIEMTFKFKFKFEKKSILTLTTKVSVGMVQKYNQVQGRTILSLNT